MNRHNYFVKILIKINKFINSLLERNLNKLNAANLKKILINNKIFSTILLLVILFLSYLSIPNIYNQNQISEEIKKNLLEKLNLEFNFKKKFLASIIAQSNHLKKNIKFEKDYLKKIEILSALILTGIVFKE